MGKKEMIYQHALALFSQKGFTYTSIDDLVEASGTSVGTIYNYFRTKYEILDYIFERELLLRTDLFHQLDDPGLCFREKCESLMRYELQVYKRAPHRSSLLFREFDTTHQGAKLPGRIKYRSALSTTYLKMVKGAREKGEIRPVPESLVVNTLLSMHLMTPLYGELAKKSASEDKLIEALIDIVFHGIA